MEANIKITFDKSCKKDILKFIGKNIDNEDFIVEESDFTQRVLTFEGEEINIDEFGGVQKGSEVFIKNDLISLIRLSKK